MKKQYIYGILSLLIVFLVINGEIIRSKYERANTKLERAVEEYSQLKKEKEGLYSDLVHTQSTNSQLKDSIKGMGEEMGLLYKRIRKDNEQIISLEKIVLTLNNKLDTITTQVDTVFLMGDTLTYKSFRAYYPDKEDWFVSYMGRFRDSLVYGSWEFGELALNLIKTKTSQGLTKIYLSGPSWIVANEVQVMEAKKEDPPKFSRVWLGGGWVMSYDNSFQGPVFKAGFDVKRKFLINGTLGGKYAEIGLLYGL